MFKANEYIVCLEVEFGDAKFFSLIARKHYCVKQLEDSFYLHICKVIDDDDNYPKSNSSFSYDKNKGLKDWRYATPEEAEHYEFLGKPYDVTTLPKFVLPEKWCVKDTCSEESNELYEYANIHGAFPPYQPSDYCMYFHFPKHDECTTSDLIEEGYTEITLAQFKTYVLGNVIVKEDYRYLIEFLTTKGIK